MMMSHKLDESIAGDLVY